MKLMTGWETNSPPTNQVVTTPLRDTKPWGHLHTRDILSSALGGKILEKDEASVIRRPTHAVTRCTTTRLGRSRLCAWYMYIAVLSACYEAVLVTSPAKPDATFTYMS
jgi:hypothetical protein